MNLDLLIAIFFPRRCAHCGAMLRTGILCGACKGALPRPRAFFCSCCTAAGASCSASAFYHKGAAGSYDDPIVRSLIHALKFRGMKSAAEPLAHSLLQCAEGAVGGWKGYAVIPVPLSRKRLLARGFNQAELIARRFAELALLPFRTDCLIRFRHAKPQSETKNILERKENIKGCFAPTDQTLIEGKRFILIDDVTTSGATLYEAAQALRAAGATRVIALAVAQA